MFMASDCGAGLRTRAVVLWPLSGNCKAFLLNFVTILEGWQANERTSGHCKASPVIRRFKRKATQGRNTVRPRRIVGLFTEGIRERSNLGKLFMVLDCSARLGAMSVSRRRRRELHSLPSLLLERWCLSLRTRCQSSRQERF